LSVSSEKGTRISIMLLFSSFCAAFVSIPLFGFKLVFPYIHF